MSLAYDVIPVTIVTGFLGSGKSTLLADVLHGAAARDTAVLVNEFGEVGLDHLLLGAIDAQTVLLDNGCVCCAIRSDLKEALASLFSRRARGELPPFSRVVLETTGLATPAPIVATLLADPLVAPHYVLNATVTVVDAVQADYQRTRHPEWLAQVSAADRIVISKADLADEATLEPLRAQLQQINPAAQIMRRSASDDAACLFAASQTVPDLGAIAARAGNAARRFEAGQARTHSLVPLGTAHAGPLAVPLPADAHHLDRIESFCIAFDEPVEWPVFTLWFTLLLNRHGDNILRVKGLLAVAGAQQPVVVHAVHHLVHPVLHLDDWPDANRTARLVFITSGVSRAAVAASWQRFCRHLQSAESVH
ncbi:GTP-binding protein [Paraburkholderia sp. SARCC-3016]|uniref:CobW family GTP-binding protein n=1 Tax=Paraburkholderia sp. SARCC-3016 TaxID=3058611 RepID=UPI0028088216|nr:GTP-binding protein [Paraburkholderia sp. SARCC-3016]MDQ7978304.1 GTP-binding protein [Paraburkholderia sp. SARCC-3016]